MVYLELDMKLDRAIVLRDGLKLLGYPVDKILLKESEETKVECEGCGDTKREVDEWYCEGCMVEHDDHIVEGLQSIKDIADDLMGDISKTKKRKKRKKRKKES